MADRVGGGTREFQVVVWGATGFVGQLCCEQLASEYGHVRWAMAGRSREKLESVRRRIAETSPGCVDIPILLADIEDAASLDVMAQRTKVIIALVGPYTMLGSPVVEACVRNHTHYVDITGEVWWIRRMIAEHHDAAVAGGTKIVHCCGYDSIPPDLGTQAVVDHIRATYNRETAKVTMVVDSAKETASGGTIASLFGYFDETSETLVAITDPYCLDPPDSRRGPDRHDFANPVGYVEGLRTWTYPFIMAIVNTRVVRRSNALLDYAWDDADRFLWATPLLIDNRSCFQCWSFAYHEAAAAGLPGFLPAYLITMVGTPIFIMLSFVKPLRPLLRRWLPKPGEGPTKEQQREGYFKHSFVGVTAEAQGVAPKVVIADMRGFRDAGYGWTSLAVLEAGLCLALQDKELRKSGKAKGGVLTPATAMGSVLLARLQQNAFTSFAMRENA